MFKIIATIAFVLIVWKLITTNFKKGDEKGVLEWIESIHKGRENG